MKEIFRMKRFSVRQDAKCMKVNTDGVLLGAWVDISNTGRILDVGTGTGVIALMMAQRSPDAHIDAVEISSHAAQLAMMNVAASPWCRRITVHATSFQQHLQSDISPYKYDLIISNPPYFDAGTRAAADTKATARHTDSLSHSVLVALSAAALDVDGRIALILPTDPAHAVIDMAHRHGLYLTRATYVHPDQDKKTERMMIELSRHKTSLKEDILYIRDAESGLYSSDYRHITRDFYLKF